MDCTRAVNLMVLRCNAFFGAARGDSLLSGHAGAPERAVKRGFHIIYKDPPQKKKKKKKKENCQHDPKAWSIFFDSQERMQNPRDDFSGAKWVEN